MNLHKDTEAFAELIEATAQAIGLPQVYVEKDYWVTKALKHLSDSPHAKHTVFKGGTSLSKAHKLIQRFSEDIDLAVFAEDLSNNARKKRIKDVEQAAAQELTTVDDDERISKGSNYRKTVYRYPRHVQDSTFGQASPEVLIEVNAFTKPEPYASLKLQTLIAEVLEKRNRKDLIEQYGLAGFPVNVLSVQRTLVEKLLGVIKDSYQDDPVAQLSKRIRHLYDICLILKLDEHRAFIKSSDFATLCAACIEDERKGFFKYSDCLEKPLKDAPVFSKFSEWSPALQRVYGGDFADLVYGEIPTIEDIEEALCFVWKYV